MRRDEGAKLLIGDPMIDKAINPEPLNRGSLDE